MDRFNMLGMKCKCLLSMKTNTLLSSNFLRHIILNLGVNSNHFISRGANLSRGYSAVNLAFTSYKPSYLQSNETTSSPIVILHGILGSKSNWSYLSKAIGEKTNREVFILDARNHGESPHSDEFSYNHMVVDTVAFMEKLQIKKAALIGHSMGGRTSMLLSLLHPELVESLIAVDIAPKGASPGFNAIPFYLKAMMDNQPTGSNLNQARKQIGEQLYKLVQNTGLVQFLLMNLVEDASKNLKWRLNLKTIYDNFKHIGEFDCDFGKVYTGPTLFIGGGDSDYIRKESHPLIKKLFPEAKIEYIPGGGHLVHVEKPKEFISMACDFINKNKQ